MSDKSMQNYANGRCCVFQPFDKDVFDKRFKEILSPAIVAAGLEPYRVDRDLGAIIPVETLHREIRSSAICVADITSRNANVMYELGYAIATGKAVIIISGPNEAKFPFDIQHRGIIGYKTESISDFENLKELLTGKLNAVLNKQAQSSSIVETSPLKESAGLKPHELTALAFLLANSDATDDAVLANTIKQDMRNAGYTDVATRLALSHLVKAKYITSAVEHGNFDETWTVYRITEEGELWLDQHQDGLSLRHDYQSNHADTPSHAEISDDDIPF